MPAMTVRVLVRNSGTQNIILYRTMIRKILLRVPQITHDTNDRIPKIRRQRTILRWLIVLDNQILNLRQFVRDTLIVMRVFFKQSLVLMGDMRADFFHKLIVALQNEHGNLTRRLRRMNGIN